MTLLGRERELRVLIGIASNWRDGREQTPNLDRRVAATVVSASTAEFPWPGCGVVVHPKRELLLPREQNG